MTRRIPDVGLEKLKANCETEVWPDQLPPTREVLLEKVLDIDGLLCLLTETIDAGLMDRAPKLKVVSNFAVGINNIDVSAATARGIRIGNTPGVLTEATADIAFALLISAARHIVEGDHYARSGNWKTWEPLGHLGLDLVGKTLGIVGLGRIGQALARRCRFGWNMQILYSDPNRKPSAERELLAEHVDFDTLLGRSDFISVHASLNPATKGMFNAEAFAKMKSTAVFINTARGPLHQQKDLVEALQSRRIFAAGLDVTDPEPPDVRDELLRLPNLVIAPHIGSATFSTRNAMAEIAADNLLAGLEGKPLRSWVNPDVMEQ